MIRVTELNSIRLFIVVLIFSVAVIAYPRISFAKELGFYEGLDRANALLSDGKYKELDAFVAKLVQENARTDSGYYFATEIIRNLADSKDGDFESVLKQINTWIEERPKSSYAHTAKAQLLCNWGWRIRGTRYVSKTGKDALLQFREKMAEAKTSGLQALAIKSDDVVALSTMLAIVRTTESREETKKYFDAVTKLVPDHAEAHFHMITKLDPRWGGTEEEMFAFAREAVKKKNDKKAQTAFWIVEAHCNAAALSGDYKEYLNKPGIWEEIETILLGLIENYPAAPYYQMKYGDLAWSAGKHEIAEKYLTAAAELAPRYYSAQRSAGKYHFKVTKNKKLAKKFLVQAVQIKSEDAILHAQLCNVYAIEDRNYKLALEQCSRAIELKPNYRWAYENRRFVHQQMGNMEKAFEDHAEVQRLSKK